MGHEEPLAPLRFREEETPWELFDELNDENEFLENDLDPCLSLEECDDLLALLEEC